MDRNKVAERCFNEMTKPEMGKQPSDIKAQWLVLADWHIAELKKARAETAKRIMLANSANERFVVSDLHGCPTRNCKTSKCCNNFIAEAEKIIEENK